MFFDLLNSQETLAETSKSNYEEAQFILNLIIQLKKLARDNQNGFAALRGKIGIITPYKS